VRPGFEGGDIDGVVEAMTPLQRLVFDLALRFVDRGDVAAHESEATDREAEDKSEWMTLRDQLREALDLLTEADVDAASDILGLAEDLQAACADHSHEADERQKALLQDPA